MPQYASLANYPVVSQLDKKTIDKLVNRNNLFECVECDIVSAIYFFHPEYRSKIDADLLQDSVLGESHTGGSDARDFVSMAAKYGVKLTSYNGLNPGQQVMAAHKFLQEGKPVIFTQFDRYVRPELNWTHASVFTAEVPNGLRCMDSLGNGTQIIGGMFYEKSDSEWMSLLRGTVLWVAEKINATQQETQITPAINVPQGWTYDGTTLMPPDKKFRAMHGMCKKILESNWNPANVLLSGEYPDGNGNIYQDCLFCTLVFSQKDGTVSTLTGDALSKHHWDIITNQDAIISHDKAVVTALQGQVDKLTSDIETLQNRLSEAQKSIDDLQGENTKLMVQMNTITQVNTTLWPRLQQLIHDVQQDTALLQLFKPFIEAVQNVEKPLPFPDNQPQQQSSQVL